MISVNGTVFVVLVRQQTKYFDKSVFVRTYRVGR